MTDVVESSLALVSESDVLEAVSLYFTSGSSDKEYHARIEAADGGFIVTVAYGRRGASLSTGTKTKSPVDHAAALKVLNKLVAEKQAKGYTQGSDGTPYLRSEAAVGNVSIPANREVPAVGTVVEVRYLYAAQGGSLYQPVYLGVRSDIEAPECVVAQLKFKTA